MRLRHVLIYIVSLITITVILGYIYGVNNTFELTDYIESLSSNNFLFLDHILTILVILFSSLSMLGLLTTSLVLAIEGCSIGYTLALFFTNFKIKGLLYGIITVAVNKLFYIVILSYLFVVCYKYSKNILNNIIGVKSDYFASLFKPLLKKYILVIIFIIIYDTLIYFFGNILLNYLLFML